MRRVATALLVLVIAFVGWLLSLRHPDLEQAGPSGVASIAVGSRVAEPAVGVESEESTRSHHAGSDAPAGIAHQAALVTNPESDADIEVEVFVADDTGTRVAGVTVYAETVEPDARRLRNEDRRSVTDERGFCRLRLFEAEFSIGINRNRNVPTHSVAIVDRAITPADRHIDLMLPRAGANLDLRFVDDLGAPISGHMRLDIALPIQAKVPKNGLHLDDLPVGAWPLWVHSVGDAMIPEPNQGVDLHPGDNEVVIRGVRKGTIVIRVEPPQPERRLRFSVTDEGWVTMEPAMQSSADDTRYELRMPPGRYRVAPRGAVRGGWFIGGSDWVEVRPGSDTQVVLPAERIAGAVTGRVLGDGGAPVVDASVRVALAGCAPSDIAFTGEDGRFELRDVPARPLDVYVDRYDLWPASQPVRRLVGPSENVEIRLPDGCVLNGEVIDPQTNTVDPTPQHVAVFNDAQAILRVPVQDGSFRIAGLPAGKYYVGTTVETATVVTIGTTGTVSVRVTRP